MTEKHFKKQEQYWDSEANTYENLETSVGRMDETPREFDYVLNSLKKGSQILDVGCGIGRWTSRLSKKGFKTKGIDLSPKMIREAKIRDKKTKYYLGNMNSLPFENEEFDAVLCMFHVIECLETQKQKFDALNEMRRVLKKGGIVFVQTHNLLTIHGLFFWIKKRFENFPKNIFKINKFTLLSNKGVEYHQHFFFPWELKDLFQKCKFELKEIKYRGWIMLAKGIKTE